MFEEPVEVDGVRYFEGLTPEYVKVWVPTEEKPDEPDNEG